MKRLVQLVLLFAVIGLGVSLKAQTNAFQNFCEDGGVKVLTSGLPSSTTVQASYPKCTVNVYLTGTLTRATIYKDNLNTPLSNPFTAFADGYWLFWAANGQGYDVVMSGGTPNAFPSPKTLTDLIVPAGGGGTSTCGPLSGDASSTNCGNGNLGGNTGTKVQTFGFTNLNYGNSINGAMAFGADNLDNTTPPIVVSPPIALGYGNTNFVGGGQYSVAVGGLNLNGATGKPCNTTDAVAVGRGNLNPCAESASTSSNADVIAIGNQNFVFAPTNTIILRDAISIGEAGYSSLSTTGSFTNTIGLGQAPINNISTGADLIAIGDDSLSGLGSLPLSVSDIVAIGDVAASGIRNGTRVMVAIGIAPCNSTSGSEIICIGDSGADNSTGSDIVAIGNNILDNNNLAGGINTGSNIVAIGNTVAAANTSGTDIVAIGDGALQGFPSISTPLVNTGNELIAIGDDALPVNTTGIDNVAIGDHAGGIGFVSGTNIGNSNKTGSNNTWIGPFAGPNTTTQLSNTIALGYQAHNTASNQTTIGNSSITSLQIFGCPTGQTVLDDGSGTCFVPGSSSFITSLTTTGSSGPATVISGVLNIPQYSGGASAFSAITSGTNTTAAMLVGSGASLGPTGTGTIQATNIASTIAAGSNVTITGAGTTASPYSIAAAASGTGISGGTAGFVPLFGSATTITGNSHLDEVTTAGVDTFTQPVAVNASGAASIWALTYSGIAPSVGSSTTAVYAVNSSGQAVTSEAGAAFSRFCTATNGVCGAGSTPVTTKGDLYGFSTIPARVPVGTNGQILTADSTATTGISWQAGGGGSTFPLTIVQDLSTVDVAANTTFTITFPQTTASSGNTAFIIMHGPTGMSTPSGWTQDFSQSSGGSPAAVVYLYHKTTASDTSVTFTWSGASDAAAYFFEVSGSHALDQSSSCGIATNQQFIGMSAITPTANSVVFGIAGIIVSTTPAQLMTDTATPLWKPLPVLGGNRVLMMFSGTKAATNVSTKPPVISFPSLSFIGSGSGIGCETFSIL